MEIYPFTLLLSLLLGAHGYRKGSLNASGAVCAALLGYCTLACSTRLFGVQLLVFYFTGSRATKYKAFLKSQFEDTSADSKGRNAVQVLCNGWVGCLCSLAWSSRSQRGYIWEDQLGRVLVMSSLAFFSCCMGDTLASELGILSTRQPFLITSLKTVPKGTNGGVSPLGLLLSLLGGTYLALSTLLMLQYAEDCSLSLNTWIKMLMLGSFFGLLGSLVDSILGATLQQTLYSSSTSQVVHHPSSGVQTRGTNVLSNNGVNFVSAGVTAALGATAPLYWS